MSITRIDVIRHGEPEGGDVFRGRINPRLTAQGRWQFEQRVARTDQPWQRIISSPLDRCRESAEALAGELQLPLTIDERWVEIDFGEWENRPVAEILQDQGDDARRLWDDPLNFRAPGGESVGELQARVIAAWQALLEQYEGEHLLVVCHGGVMRALAQHLIQLAPAGMNRLAIPYAGLLRFRVDKSQWQGKTDIWTSLESLDGTELKQPEGV